MKSCALFIEPYKMKQERRIIQAPYFEIYHLKRGYMAGQSRDPLLIAA